MKEKNTSLHSVLLLLILLGGFWVINLGANRVQAMNICIDSHGKKVFTNNVCPDGYHLKGEEEKKKEPSPEEDKKDYSSDQTLEWDTYQIVVKDIKMSWLLVEDNSQKEPIYYPQMELKVINNSKEIISGLKVILIYQAEGGATFGETSKYLKQIGPGGESISASMRPGKGYSYTGFNGDAITDTTFKVLIIGRYNGEKKELGTVDFYSKKTGKTSS